MSISGIYSLNEELNMAENGLSTSAVDIDIKEYNQNNQLFDRDGEMVMPGDEIILIPRINNLGIECYLRAKIEYTINNEVFSVNDYIKGNYTSWHKNGDYYYYNSVFAKESSIDLFNKVIIPNLSSDYNGKKVIVHIIVDAVQAKNFDGNWDNVTIKKSVNRAYDINYDGESSIVYEDNIDHHILFNNKFFNRLGNMLPGDSVKETISILNNSDFDNEYYLSIDYDNLSNEELALLQKMKLLIRKHNNDILVDSNLADKSKHSLGRYSKGKEDNLTIEISLPKDTDNDFSKLFAKIIWRFSYDNLNQNEEVNPQTGDYGFDLSIILFIISAIGFLIVLILEKKDNNIENNLRKGD